jgi:hypothetical protein
MCLREHAPRFNVGVSCSGMRTAWALGEFASTVSTISSSWYT